jgi:CRP-like cAMP-binding protein
VEREVSTFNPSPKTQPFENQILAALPPREQKRLLPYLERVTLHSGQQISEAGERVRHAYFPESALISLLSVNDDGTSVEVRLIGSEGILGIPIFLRSATMPYRATVRIAGSAYRMKSDPLNKEFDRCGPFHDLLLRHIHLLVTQLSQLTVCNRFHTVGQRLCRWLLSAQDRLKSPELQFTQDFLSQMLGTDRTSITAAAGVLQKAGLIRYNRGRIMILNREGLAAMACHCHWIISKEFDRLFRE